MRSVGDGLVCPSLEILLADANSGAGVGKAVLATRRQRPKMLLPTVHCTGQPHSKAFPVPRWDGDNVQTSNLAPSPGTQSWRNCSVLSSLSVFCFLESGSGAPNVPRLPQAVSVRVSLTHPMLQQPVL